MHVNQTRKILALGLAYAISVLPAVSCGNYSTDEFTWSDHPMFPEKTYIGGNLGIVLPTFDTSYLVVAYRYFSGKNLSASEVDGADDVIENQMSANGSYCDEVDESAWLNARKTVLGGTDNAEVETSRTVSGDTTSYICNIQTNAFVTAAKTLNNLVTRFGADNPSVKDWIKAQDMVFENGSSATPSIPEPLLTGDKLLQQDRAYQIAAANFYAMQLDNALALFTKIGQDRDSSWSHISRYLVVRSLIRKATTAEDTSKSVSMKEAKKQVDTLLVDPAMADLHEDLLDLADLIVDKLIPEDKSLAKQRDRRLATTVMTKISARSLMEYTDVFDRITDASHYVDPSPDNKPRPLLTGVSEMTTWINTFQSPKSISRAQALARWKATNSLPWLIAALAVTNAKDKDIPKLLAAAAKVNPSNRAFATVSYEVAKLLMDEKQFDQARKHIDQALLKRDLDLSSHNRLLDLRLQLARNVNDFARDSIGKSVGQSDTGGPDAPLDPDNKESQKQAIMPFARLIYDEGIPLAILKTASESRLYSAENRRLLAKRAWVKSILVGDETVAKALANTLKTTDKSNASYYASYLHASTPAERKFAAAFVMLHNDDSSPSVTALGEPWSPWWWTARDLRRPKPGDPSLPSRHPDLILKGPLFLSTADKAASAAEVAKLKKMPSAPAYLAAIAVNWAKSHPHDARVAEALHFAVRCTRFGERDHTSSMLSKEAFMILHHNYARNSWTEETPYYFGS